ncbi:MAG TPA: DUF167 domain-containing protein [Bdellovibrionota bacterium]|nr:DUF167 domain-containing protein [Bdellovibrionota bacterium]
MTSQIREADGGVYIPVRVQPRAKREEIAGMKNGILQVRLNTRPVQGAANRRLIEILADRFHVPKTFIRIVAGAKNKNKTLFVPGMTSQALMPEFKAAVTGP